MKRVVNIMLSVIDNFGDIGFACELLAAFERRYPGVYRFDIWTDDIDRVETFFERNREVLGSYKIGSSSGFGERIGDITLLLFHHELPREEKKGVRKELFLRIDYLSFDPLWVRNHGNEHIASNAVRKIIEIIPSPLSHGGGLILPEQSTFARRAQLGKKYGLDPTKEWISIFAYRDSLSRIRFDHTDTQCVLLFGEDHSRSDENTVTLPFLPFTELYSCIRESAWAIIRGEVSFISTLQIGTPLLWNMYHEIGGYNHGQAREFLDWRNANSTYRDLSNRLNGRKDEGVCLSEISDYFRKNPWKNYHSEKNIVEEIQKYIDSFGFSL